MNNDENLNKEQSSAVTTYFGEHAKPVLFDVERRDIIFCALAIFSGVFTAFLGIAGSFAIGFTVSILLTLAVLVFYFSKNGKTDAFAICCGILAVINSLLFFTTSNSSVKFFAFIEIAVLSLVFLQGLLGKKEDGDIIFFANILGNFGASIFNMPTALKSIMVTVDTKKKTFTKSILGVLCAIPVLLVVVPLLISSDTAFEGFITYILDNSINSVLKIALGLFLSVIIISYGFSLKKDRANVKELKAFAGLDNTYIISFLSAISVFYILYMFSQLAYFFSAFSGFLPEDYVFTLSGYARRGFFEMAIISAINFVLVFFCIIFSGKKDGKVSLTIKIFCTFIIIFTMLIIATALSKMFLYIGNFGMTVSRITTSSFMIFLAVVFIALLIRVYINKIKVLKVALITAGCVLTLLGTVNVNAFAAKYNYEHYLSGTLDGLDINAIYELGDEGVPYLVKIAEANYSDTSSNAKEYLYKCYSEDYFEEFSADELRKHQKYSGLASFTLPRARAYSALYEYLENNPEFSEYVPYEDNIYGIKYY